MYAWLNGPGKVFRNPIPGSTNYLAAYDRQGRLIRASRGGEQRKRLEDPELDEDEDVVQARELEAGMSEADVSRRADLRVKKRLEKEELEARGGVPKERAGDLRPYPLNQQFRSQAVLSQELRDKIYEMIVEQGFDLKSVSAAFGVDIRRVAAVVRLGSIEREWIKEVSHNFRSAWCCDGYCVMIPIQNSISLEDQHMVTNDSFASLSDFCPSHRCSILRHNTLFGRDG